MKYAIYDKAADGYLTKLEFENDIKSRNLKSSLMWMPYKYNRFSVIESRRVDLPVQTLGLICGYNEYITEAKLLDTKEEAVAVVTRIESNKFMEKGRYVIHSFDEELADKYIISEAGTPTKVVDSITVDLDGSINVKYGTMLTRWSTKFLEYAINRMNALQKAASTIYTPWCNTFDIYKVITVTDERSCTHYQFINVTAKGLDEYAKDEEEKLLVAGNEIVNATTLLNKRIEDLEKANYELGERVTERGVVANRLLDENNNLKTKVEAIKKESRDWKTLYENANRDREVLTNVIDNIYDDLGSTDICKDLKETYAYVKSLSELNYIKIHNDDTADGKPIYIRAAAEFKYIINQIITIMESRELNQSVAEDFADEIVTYKNKAIKATKDLEDQKKLNETNKATIAQMVIEKRAMNKELSDWKRRTEEAIRDYTKCNEALGEWKKKYRAIQEERDNALERAEKFKGIANSVYGMTMPSRCNGKQMFCDIATGKKILIDKKKYDELVEWIDAINTTYDTMFFMNKPAYLPLMIEHLNDLTK